MPIRILHTADLHLDSPLASLAMRDPALRDRVGAATRKALERIVSFCLSNDVAALLIAGDLFDRAERSMKTAAFVAAQMERLAAAGIRVFYVKGNHDAENPSAGEIRLPANVHVFGARGGREQLAGHDVWVHGVSFRDARAPESLLPLFAAPVAGTVNIAMLHTSLAGAAGHDPYAPCTVAELAAAGFDYWALGHVHKRQVHAQRPWIVMPGTPQGRDIGEDGPKSATLIEIGDGGAIAVSEVPTSAVEFRRIGIDVTGCEDETALERLLARRIAEEAASGSAELSVLRLRATGSSGFGWRIERDIDRWRETCATLAADTGKLFLESLTLDLLEPAAAAGPSGAVGELERLMREIAAEEGFLADAREELRAILEKLPANRRDALAADEGGEAALLQATASAAASAMAARMRGASEAAG